MQITAIKDGTWTDPTCWDLLRIPAADDDIDLASYQLHINAVESVDYPSTTEEYGQITGSTGSLSINYNDASDEQSSIRMFFSEILGGSGPQPLIKILGNVGSGQTMLRSTYVTGGEIASAIYADVTRASAEDFLLQVSTGSLITGGGSQEAYGVEVRGDIRLETTFTNIRAGVGRALGLFNSLKSLLYDQNFEGGQADCAIYKDSSGELEVARYAEIIGGDVDDGNPHHAFYIAETNTGDVTFKADRLDDDDNLTIGTLKGGGGNRRNAGIFNKGLGRFRFRGNVEAGVAPAMLGKPPHEFNDDKDTYHVKPARGIKKFYKIPSAEHILKNVVCGDIVGTREDADPDYVLTTHSYANPTSPTTGNYIAPPEFTPIAAENVRAGVEVGQGVGTMFVPDPEDVRDNLSVPDPAYVRAEVPIDNSTGTMIVPQPDQVLAGVPIDGTIGSLQPEIGGVVIL